METDSVYYAKHLINWTYGGGGVGSVTKTEQTEQYKSFQILVVCVQN